MNRTTQINIWYAAIAVLVIVSVQQWWAQRQEVEPIAYSELGRARGIGPFGGGHDEKGRPRSKSGVSAPGGPGVRAGSHRPR